jgi:GNAT superfamily N-acetyltransferase
MEPIIRPARPEDAPQIEGWTRDTFPWGDYVGREFSTWLEEPRSLLLVAEVGHEIVGMAKAAMLSDYEAWAQGARVHPEYRRQGIGTAISTRLWNWAVEQGAQVVRLAVEDWNEPARGQVAAVGFRPVSQWVMAERGVGENSPVPEGNGGRRVKGAEALRPAHSSEATPARMAWAASDLETASRGLFPTFWRWRRLTMDDLAEAARRRALVTGRPGWAIAEVDEDTYLVSWMATTQTDAPAMVRGLVDLAASAGSERIELFSPAVDWMTQALRRRDCELHNLTVYALGL